MIWRTSSECFVPNCKEVHPNFTFFCLQIFCESFLHSNECSLLLLSLIWKWEQYFSFIVVLSYDRIQKFILSSRLKNAQKAFRLYREWLRFLFGARLISASSVNLWMQKSFLVALAFRTMHQHFNLSYNTQNIAAWILFHFTPAFYCFEVKFKLF